jgi:signal transduction histidine kinase
LVRQYINSQEDEFLAAYAQVISNHAVDYISPEIEYEQLYELVNTISILGNFRVMIHDSNHELIIDSGSPPQVDNFPWIIQELRVQSDPEQNPFVITIPDTLDLSSSRIREIPPGYIEALLEQIQTQYLRRANQPLGRQIFLRDVSNSILGLPIDRSRRTLSLPIGESDIPNGYVQVLEGPDFGAETLETTKRVFLIVAGCSVLLSGIIGLFISRRLTSPIVQLTDIAGQMSTGDLSVRSPVFGKDEIGQLAQRFNQMAERLEESFTILSGERDTLRRFISDASHELRTPITAMKNFIELLQGKAIKDTEARNEFLSKSQIQLDRMEWITQNLLDLSRLEAGLLALNLEQRSVKDILASITASFKSRADKEDIKFLIGEPDLSFDVLADQSLLEIALFNLLDNALKFTSKGGKIKITAGDDEDQISFSVQDTGTGIKEDDLPHIFERFYRGKSVTAEGSGLGLAMVESVVKAHGGQINVETEPDIGSTFSIILPKSIETSDQHSIDPV